MFPKGKGLDGDEYRKVVNRTSNFLKEKYGSLDTLIWMQDGAPCHTARLSRELLAKLYGERVISRWCAFEWAGYSADLNPLDFWLWHFLKTFCYKKRTKSLSDLKLKVGEFFKDLSKMRTVICYKRLSKVLMTV